MGMMNLFDPEIFYHDCMKTAGQQIADEKRQRSALREEYRREEAERDRIRNTDLENLFD